MDCVSILVVGDTNQEVVWFDITVDQRFIVDRLNARNLCDGEAESDLSFREGIARWAPKQQ